MNKVLLLTTIIIASAPVWAQSEGILASLSELQGRIQALEEQNRWMASALSQSVLASVAPCSEAREAQWVAFDDAQGRFLLGASDKFLAGSKDGEETVLLTIDEMPSHEHNPHKGYSALASDGRLREVFHPDSNRENNIGSWHKSGSAGGSLPHNNMPPYLVIHFCIFNGPR
ncbi:hypothetical protein [Salipiger thiooxidans]|uniref:hypothetical protein n=1 Tax=Salipiger thiooxidans TaxID=282683 RepID=UPI00104284A7|nr:hypothetical protein [Salipiger thiooxidans]